VRAIVGDSGHVALANTIAERGVVLARDSLRLVPVLQRGRRQRVLAVTYARRSDLGAGVTFNAALRRDAIAVSTAYVDADETTPDLTPVQAALDSADVVIVGSYVNISSSTASASAPSAFSSLLAAINARTRNVILVSFGTPYLLQQAPDVSTYVVAWGGMPATQRAAARALLGESPINARLPVSIPPLLPLRAGESRPVRSAVP
jgi:beta-N-acetylhexosaminidase